jgi:hypothetical protein
MSLLISACGSEDATDDRGNGLFPDVIAVESDDDDGSWTFSVTISSPYDSAEQYADAWRVLGPDGTEYGFRLLTHDHAGEQPFTRSQRGITIPDDVDVVTVEARDLLNGWGGGTVDHQLER